MAKDYANISALGPSANALVKRVEKARGPFREVLCEFLALVDDDLLYHLRLAERDGSPGDCKELLENQRDFIEVNLIPLFDKIVSRPRSASDVAAAGRLIESLRTSRAHQRPPTLTVSRVYRALDDLVSTQQ